MHSRIPGGQGACTGKPLHRFEILAIQRAKRVAAGIGVGIAAGAAADGGHAGNGHILHGNAVGAAAQRNFERGRD